MKIKHSIKQNKKGTQKTNTQKQETTIIITKNTPENKQKQNNNMTIRHSITQKNTNGTQNTNTQKKKTIITKITD